MKIWILAAAALTASAFAGAGEGSRTLTPYGLGKVVVGMTIAQAEQALGEKLKQDYQQTNGDESCGYAWSKTGLNNGISFLVENRTIKLIEISPLKTGRSAIITATKIGIGSSETAVKAAYGARLRVEPHPYLETGHYLIVDEPDKSRGIIFETNGKQVAVFRSGVYPALGYIEGCL